MQFRQLILAASALAITGTSPALAQRAPATPRHPRERPAAAVQLSTTGYATAPAPQSDPLQATLAPDRLQSEAFVLGSARVAALAAVNALRNRRPGDSLGVVPMNAAQV